MNRFPSKETVERLRKQYPHGCRVELVRMNDPYATLKPGDRKQSDVWEIPRPKVSEEHPTMKPVSLVAKAMLNSSRSGDAALDLFGGSGTTLIASEQTGRKCRMMELDPKYCDVIAKRYVSQFGSDSVSMLRDGESTSYDELMA